MINNVHRIVEHVDDSIVHKKILSSKSGSITVFAIADDESIAEHKNRHCEYVYVLSGIIELQVEDRQYLLEKGALYSIKANTLHTVNGYQSGKFALIILKNKRENESGRQKIKSV